MNKYLSYYEPFNFKKQINASQWINSNIDNSNNLFLKKQKYLLNKESIYLKLKLLKELKENIIKNFFLNKTKDIIINNDIENYYHKFKIIYYKYEEKLNIKLAIFQDEINNEFNICLDCKENNEDYFEDFSLCKQDINLLEEKFICNNYFNKKKDDFVLIDKNFNIEENNVKINNKLLNDLSNSLILYSLFFKINQLHKIYNNKYKFTYVAHGKSGAFLSLFVYFYYKLFKNKYCNILTFGMPRYGNKNYKKEYNSKHNIDHWNIINKNDLMSSIPIIDYNHVGQLFFIENNNEIKTEINYSYFGLLYRLSLINCNNKSDHELDNYIDSIKQCKNIIKNNVENIKIPPKVYLDLNDNLDLIKYYDFSDDESDTESDINY